MAGRFDVGIPRGVKPVGLPLAVPVIVGVAIGDGRQNKCIVAIADIGHRVACMPGFVIPAFARGHSVFRQCGFQLPRTGSVHERPIAWCVHMGERHAALVKHCGAPGMARGRSTVMAGLAVGFRRASVLTVYDFQLGTAICMISVARRRMAAAEAGAVTITAIVAAMSLTA